MLYMMLQGVQGVYCVLDEIYHVITGLHCNDSFMVGATSPKDNTMNDGMMPC